MTDEPKPKSEDFEPLKSAARSWSEEIEMAGTQMVDKLKELTHEGNVRNLKLKSEGRVLLEVPLTAAAAGGVIGVLIAPQLAILGAIAGVLAHVTVEIEHQGPPPADRLIK